MGGRIFPSAIGGRKKGGYVIFLRMLRKTTSGGFQRKFPESCIMQHGWLAAFGVVLAVIVAPP
jgi:hypothetical protein